jgi:hypothetical protein
MHGDFVKVPPRYRPLLRRLQRGTWTRAELLWLLAHDPGMPVIVAGLVRQKM